MIPLPPGIQRPFAKPPLMLSQFKAPPVAVSLQPEVFFFVIQIQRNTWQQGMLLPSLPHTGHSLPHGDLHNAKPCTEWTMKKLLSGCMLRLAGRNIRAVRNDILCRKLLREKYAWDMDDIDAYLVSSLSFTVICTPFAASSLALSRCPTSCARSSSASQTS